MVVPDPPPAVAAGRRRRRPAPAQRQGLALLLLLPCLLLDLAAGFRLPLAPWPVRQAVRGIVPSALPSSSTAAHPATLAALPPAAARAAGLRARFRPCHRPPAASSAALEPPPDDANAKGGVIVQQQEEEEEGQVVPSLGALLRFTIPTLGIWLAGPIMSLVRRRTAD